jgi:hypothetical protein
MKRNTIALALSLGVLLNSPSASALEFLDDMIYSVKCAGAEDVPACKAKAKKDYDDYARKKQDGEVIGPVDGGSVQRNQGYQERCEETSASGPANVDVAYNRAMNKYRFPTPEQYAHTKHPQPGVNHARVPGVRYDIASQVRYPGYTDVSMHVDLTLIKSESGSGSTLHAEYCMATSDKYPNPQFHNQAFWKKVASDFRSLVR